MSCWWWRRRQSVDVASDVVEGSGEEETSLRAAGGRWSPGLWRRHRCGASEPKAFLLLKQGAGGVAEGGQGRGVRHVEAGRWEKADGLDDSGVPVRRTVCGPAWLNQQRGL